MSDRDDLRRALMDAERELVHKEIELAQAREMLEKAADQFADFAVALRLLRHDTMAVAADLAEGYTRAVLTSEMPA